MCVPDVLVCGTDKYMYRLSHRNVHQARIHIDNITATYQINDANKQRR